MLNYECKYAEPAICHAFCMETMGQRIRLLRQAKRLTQLQLAELCGVTKAAVSQWETDSTNNIKLKPLLLLVKHLGTDLRFLVYGSETTRQTPPDGRSDRMRSRN